VVGAGDGTMRGAPPRDGASEQKRKSGCSVRRLRSTTDARPLNYPTDKIAGLQLELGY